MKNVVPLIENQVRHFASSTGEQGLFRKVDRFFLGEPWASTTVGESESALMKSSTNFVFAVVETAKSVLIPKNPQITTDERRLTEPYPKDALEMAERWVNSTLDRTKYRAELERCIESVVKYGRGPAKTSWDEDLDRPITRYLDPSNYFFDQTAQRWSEVRYEFELTVLSETDVKKRVEAGMYDADVLKKGKGGRYPAWLLENKRNINQELINFQSWYPVYEFYDWESGRVYHTLLDKVILEADAPYRPYDLLTFNNNGKNCGGISEIGLILSNQEEYNWTETYLLNLLRFAIPGVLYDARMISETEVAKMMKAPLGAAVGLKPSSSVTSLADAFSPRPTSQPPQLAETMLASKRDGIFLVSALSDAMRAQTVGAKTATELAFLEGNIKNRLQPRLNKVEEFTVDVAEKHLLLTRMYKKNPEKVQYVVSSVDPETKREVTETRWLDVLPSDLEGIKATFKMVAYSPMEANKAVRAETLRNSWPMLSASPFVHQQRLIGKMLSYTGDEDVLMTPDELAQQSQAAAVDAATQTAPVPPPGAVEPLVTPAEGSDLPPRAAALSEAVSSPATPTPAESTPS